MSKHEKINIKVQSPLVLEDSDKVWMVLNGDVNVFSTRIDENGDFQNSLKFLYSAAKGDLIFSLLSKDSTECTRIILYSSGASLLPINKTNLINIDHLYLKGMINKWIKNSTNSFSYGNSPRIYTAIDHFNEIIAKNEEIIYPAHGISWIQLIKGKISIYSEDLELSSSNQFLSPIPVSNKLWLKVLEDKTELKVISINDLLNDEINFLLSIERLQNHFYKQLNEIFQNVSNEEKDYFSEKSKNEVNQLNNTLNQISSVIDGTRKSYYNNQIGGGKKNNLLFNTCKVISEHAGFKIEEPKHIDSFQKNVSNQLTAISKSSNVRIRKIILRDTWWKDENGHLLAFTKENNLPVALIQNDSKKGYVLKNLSTSEEKQVNNEVAQELEPIGYMFLSGFDRKMSSIKEVLSFAMKGLKNDTSFLIFAALAGSLVGLLVPVLSGIMFDDIIPTADRSLHFDIFLIMLITGFVLTGLQLVQGVLQMRVESKSSINLQAAVMDYILRLPVTFYKKYSSGDLTNRVLSINSIRQILSNTLITATLSGAFSFVNLILLFYYESRLAWMGILLGVVAGTFMIIVGLLKLKYDRQISKEQGELQGFLFEFLSGISKIRITGGESRVFSLWAEKFSRLKRLSFNSGTYQNFVETFNASYPLFTSILFFSFLYYSIATSDGSTSIISVGAFMAFITSFNKFLNDTLRLSMAIITSLNVIPLYERVRPILEAELETVEGSTDPGELAGDIEINSLSFRYHPDQPLILKDLSFKIKQGEMVAFVGASGSGKSTVMRLLLGFEQAESGSIFYDGESFESMNKELVRRQIGVVLQNGSLMSGSIYQNIVGNSELTLDDAWEAARMAGMDEDIKHMPMEMHTVVSEGAGTFSGGQRQRLMIARAIVHKPRLLFMDEATSALDNRTQTIVSESLEKLQATRIVIAHRLSTIKNADRIFVMDKGQIVESGTYEELMKLDGLFSTLAKRQIA